jgi:hypothetical protein
VYIWCISVPGDGQIAVGRQTRLGTRRFPAQVGIYTAINQHLKNCCLHLPLVSFRSKIGQFQSKTTCTSDYHRHGGTSSCFIDITM